MRFLLAPALLAAAALAGCGSVPPAYVESCLPQDQPARSCLRDAPRATPLVRAGDQATVHVDAQCRWNRTGIQLVPGVHYELAAGTPQAWIDGGNASDLALGWTERGVAIEPAVRRFARTDRVPMYALAGTEGADESTAFLVGHGTTHTARSASELMLFANDWSGFYRNNDGCVALTVRRAS